VIDINALMEVCRRIRFFVRSVRQRLCTWPARPNRHGNRWHRLL